MYRSKIQTWDSYFALKLHGISDKYEIRSYNVDLFLGLIAVICFFKDLLLMILDYIYEIICNAREVQEQNF